MVDIDKIAIEVYDYTVLMKADGLTEEQMKPLVKRKVESYNLKPMKLVKLLKTYQKYLKAQGDLPNESDGIDNTVKV